MFSYFRDIHFERTAIKHSKLCIGDFKLQQALIYLASLLIYFSTVSLLSTVQTWALQLPLSLAGVQLVAVFCSVLQLTEEAREAPEATSALKLLKTTFTCVFCTLVFSVT